MVSENLEKGDTRFFYRFFVLRKQFKIVEHDVPATHSEKRDIIAAVADQFLDVRYGFRVKTLNLIFIFGLRISKQQKTMIILSAGSDSSSNDAVISPLEPGSIL